MSNENLPLRRRIARLEHDAAARKAGIIEAALEDAWNRNGDSIRVGADGKVEFANGAIDFDDFFATRRGNNDAHWYSTATDATVTGPTPAEVAAMSPEDKIRLANAATKPAGIR